MVSEKMKSVITCFTPGGEYLVIFSDNENFKFWNTNNGRLLVEWKLAGEDSETRISCMACSSLKKKRKKEQGRCLVAFGTEGGDVLAFDVFTTEMKWKSTVCHPSGLAGLSFANKGRNLHAVGTNGLASKMNSETGELIREFKISKRSIFSSAFSCDGKTIVAAGSKIQVSRFENVDEQLRFSSESGPVQYVSVSEDAKFVVTSCFGEKQLKVWMCDLSAKAVSSGPDLSMRNPPLAIECKNSCNGVEGLVVLSVSESGVAYLWNLDISSWEDVNPTKITVKARKAEKNSQHGGRQKSHTAIIASRLQALQTDGRIKVLVAYGSIDCPQFFLADVTSPGETITIYAGDESVNLVTTSQENEVQLGEGLHETELKITDGPAQKKKVNKKRAASDQEIANTGTSIDDDGEQSTDGVQTYDDLNEPTIGEKLASFNLVDKKEDQSLENTESSPMIKPPSADSIHVLLKQALHANDRTLLLDCLYRQDEKVISNSVSQLNPSDVLKLLESLVSIIQSRGAVMARALPWLRSLLLQHASGIMAQESSLLFLNSLYQLIESRISTFHKALQLSSCLDLLYAGTVDDGIEENETIIPAFYVEKNDSEEEGSEDAMETDTDEDGQKLETTNYFSDDDGSDVMNE